MFRIAVIKIAFLTASIFLIGSTSGDTADLRVWEEIAWSPTGELIALSTSAGSPRCGEEKAFVYLVEPDTLKLIHRLEAGNCAIGSLDWNSDGTLLAGAGLGSPGLFIWDVESGQIITTSQIGGEGLISAQWHPTLNQVAVTSIGEVAAIVDASSGELVREVYLGIGVDWSPLGDQLAVVGRDDNDISIVNGLTGSLQLVLAGQSMPTKGLDWSPDGLYIAGVGTDDTIRIWNTSGVLISSFSLNGAIRVRWSPDSQRLAAGGIESLVIWDLAFEEIIDVIPSNVSINSFDWSPDGKQLAYGGEIIHSAPPTFEVVTVAEKKRGLIYQAPTTSSE